MSDSRTRALVRTAGARAAAGVAFAVTAACAFVPLADHLGFEFAGVLAIALALAAPAVGVAAVRLEEARPPEARRPERAALAAMLVSAALVPLAGALMLLNTVRRPVCDPWSGALWMAALPLPSALLGAAVGALARVRGGRARRAAALVALVEAASLGVNLWSLYDGPAFYVFDHFFGYFPGPLYDETVLLGATVWGYRAVTAAWAGAAALACGISSVDGTRARTFGFVASVFAGALATLGLAGGEWVGVRTTDASLARALGGVRRTARLELHYPREWSEKQVAQLVQDAEFRAAQVVEALGLAAPAPVRVWMYRSSEEKRRLVGAAATSFAKPWRREVHVHASGFPHPVLRHELVHAYAADLAPGPFRVPGGLFPNSPLVEGLAVAYDAEPEGMTLERWARAMRLLGLAPDAGALFSSAGFLGSAPSRAYSYAGAFLRHLARTRGNEAVFALYRSGDLSSVGEPRALVAEFEAALDAIELGPDELAAARRRYARPSVFHRRCAREVSGVTQAAGEALAGNETKRALALYEEACALEPDDPALVRELLSAAIRARDEARAEAAAQRLFAHAKVDAGLRASTLVELGDAAWRRGERAKAAALFDEAARLDVDAATHRGAVARVRALEDEARAALLELLLAHGSADLERLFAMSEHLAARPEDALVAYLLGRQLAQRDAPARAATLLARAEGRLGDRELERENARLLARARSEAGLCDEASALAARVEEPSDRAWALDWAARCRHRASSVY